VRDIAEIIRDKRAEFDFSPEELDRVEGRCDQLYRLRKKYGASVADMLKYLEKCRAELNATEMADDTLKGLKTREKQAEQAVMAAGMALRSARKDAANILEKRILKELRDLNMSRMRFSIDFQPREAGTGGLDQIRFLMSANTGESLRPIARIASGGELSRIMLALKNVLAEQDSVAAMVFDEIDAGISGQAAQKVAEKLAQVSRRKQVLCVTHLPQMAAMADTHFSVEKGENNGRTYTKVTCLSREQRACELTRMIGGSRVSDSLLRSAEELLDAAEEYRSGLVISA
jgi:DNA repair protein RecN (Recombination protein N)